MQFGLLEMWQSMSPLAKAVAILLITMSIVSLYFFIEREMFFRKAKSRSKELAPKLAAASSTSMSISSSAGCNVRTTNGRPMKVSATMTPQRLYAISMP